MQLTILKACKSLSLSYIHNVIITRSWELDKLLSPHKNHFSPNEASLPCSLTFNLLSLSRDLLILSKSYKSNHTFTLL